jgi:outer membrane receptor protein involved in Fe transport
MASGINHRLRTLTALLAVCLIVSSAWAGKGKIQGTVTDSESKLPIAAASVSILSTNWGAATASDGSFVIIGVDPGTVNVKVSSVGYHNQIITGVLIQTDLTTELKVQLTQASIARPEVTITYTKPAVDKTKPYKGTVVSHEKLEKLKPEDIDAIVGSTTGFKVDPEGKLHARGGRSGEVAFVVEGTDTRDAVVDTRNSYMVSTAAVEEVDVLTGGFNAEYGNAGAIVQITTAEGDKNNYSGRLDAQTDRLIDTYSFDTDRMELDLSGPLPYSEKLLGNPVTFYLSSIGFLTNTYTPFNVNRPANDYLGIGINLPERQDNNYQTSLKLANNLSETRKLTLFLSESYHKWDIYPYGEGGIDGNYGYGYKYDLANRPYAVNKQFSGNLTFTDQPTSKTYYTLKLASFYTASNVAERGKNPGQMTLLDDIENNLANAFDRNGDGKLQPDEYTDQNGDSFMDGYWDANKDGIFEGGGEGYEDLNMNGKWDRGEDWVDLNGNGIYDAAEPWIDVVNPLTGENNIGIFDPWDSYTDINHNGRWDAAEPQLSEQDWNHNGKWDGERFIDANGNGKFDPYEPYQDLNRNYQWDPGEPFTDLNGNGKHDDGEGYDDVNKNGQVDKRDLQARVDNPDTPEPFIDGDFYYDTGEPFIDEPDPVTGLYNGTWDPGEIWFDLPGPTLNGRYDGPDGEFEPYELFTRPADLMKDHNPSRPVIYTFDEQKRGSDWPQDIYHFIAGKSTWINRTINDTSNPVFDEPNFAYDAGKEWFDDYNGNGTWNGADYFLNPGLYDPTAYWYERKSIEYSVKFDIQSQVSKYHLIKSGWEMKYRDLQMQSISQPDLKYTGEATLPDGSPWPDRGGVRDFYNYKPWEGAAYVQDKMEFQGLIVNAGLRIDFIIHDKKAIDEFRARLLRDEPGALLAQRGTYRVSPRLGISHPITEQAKLYFNYGHFYQAQSFQYFYKSATANFNSNSTIGNPNLEYEKTIQYELGVNTQVSTDVVIDVSGYYKDQYDLISTTDERWKNLTLDRYVNLDYGRMRGFELSIEKRPSNHYALTFNYDFSFAFGKASDQHANLQARLQNIPYNYDEHPLNWDETHKINAYATILYDKNDHPKLLGLVLPDDWMTTLQWEFGSGLPYTPSKYTTGIDNANLILPNSARLPWHERTTLKFEKYYTLNVKKGTKFIFGITINNLFNKSNVQSLYPETGSPKSAIHPLDPSYNPTDNRTGYDANPRNYEPGRQVSFRVGMEF